MKLLYSSGALAVWRVAAGVRLHAESEAGGPLVLDEPTMPELPAWLVPSLDPVMAHDPTFGEEDPALRPSCSAIIEEIHAHTLTERQSPDLAAFESLVMALSLSDEKLRQMTAAAKVEEEKIQRDADPSAASEPDAGSEKAADGATSEVRPQAVRLRKLVQRGERIRGPVGEIAETDDPAPELASMAKHFTPAALHKKFYSSSAGYGDSGLLDADKVIASAIEVMRTTGRRLHWAYIASLRNCSVDKLGRTIVMRVALRGLSHSFLKAALAFPGVELHKLRDLENCNLLHLSVKSGNAAAVSEVLRMIGSDHLLGMLQARNMAGEMPIDIAGKLHLADISDLLKAANRVHAAAAFSKYKFLTPDEQPTS